MRTRKAKKKFLKPPYPNINSILKKKNEEKSQKLGKIHTHSLTKWHPDTKNLKSAHYKQISSVPQHELLCSLETHEELITGES